MRRFSAPLLGLAVLLGCNLPATASFQIILDYTHDDAGSGFFPAGSDQRLALQAAADDINAILATTLVDITNDPHTTTTVIDGRNNSVTINPSLGYINPDTGASETYDPVTPLGADEFRIFVGGRNLSGPTLAQGGRGSVGVGFSGSGFESDWLQAVENAETSFNAEYGRGAPIMSTLTGTLTLGAVSAPYSLTFGPTLGHLWFDTDTNNDLAEDSAAELDAWWHYDHNASVAGGQFDIYTVAVHEMLHALGFSSGSEAFGDNISGTQDWTGPAVIAEVGTGTGVLHTDSSHIDLSLTSTRLSDGVAQDPVMLPTISSGTRRELTHLDAAFLTDMGYTVIPEPGTFLALAPLLLFSAIGIRRRPRRDRVA